MSNDSVRAQFAPVARNYVTSHFHADPERLREIVELAEPQADQTVLDVATGTGHAALALAPHVRWAIGLDITPEMLDRAAAAGRAAGCENVTWVLGDAADLPFPAASFDLYVARAAPHHFPDLETALAEAFRVLRPGGAAVVIDCSPPPEARDFLHEVELARDPTHVRSSTLQEWRDALGAAGFEIEVARRRQLTWRFANWMATMDVGAEEQQRLERMIENGPPAVHAALKPVRRGDGDLWHNYWHALVRARKPA